MVPSFLSLRILDKTGHDSVTKSPPGSGKSSLSHVLRIHFDLVVPVNERQHCMVDSVINQYINDGKRVIILGTSLVQIYVVYTSLPSHLSSPLSNKVEGEVNQTHLVAEAQKDHSTYPKELLHNRRHKLFD